MGQKLPRFCTKCGYKLSMHNPFEVCFHHPEHPDYSPINTPEISVCSTRGNEGVEIMTYNYQG